jgi:hypothetical protein
MMQPGATFPTTLPPLQGQSWYQQLHPDQQQLLALAWQLYEDEAHSPSHHRVDYSFVVFTAAKAYEGYLKDLLLSLHLIDATDHTSRRFRIGRALNPDVGNGQRDEWWLYDDLSGYCGEELGRQLWETWLVCRNHLFHYFPGEAHFLSLPEAKSCLEMIQASIAAATACMTQRQSRHQPPKLKPALAARSA